MSWYETYVDRAIREAQERGDFDDLPGAGQPLPDRGELYDEDWWIKQLIVREQLGGLAPTTLKIRKEAEELMTTLAAKTSEAEVRAIVVDLNRRIDRAQRSLVDGPPVVLKQFDVDEVVRQWHDQRPRS
jgi:hypothetical protein